MPKPAPADDTRTIRLGASRSITVGRGSVVMVRWGGTGSYAAVVRKVAGATAWLTFTPRHAPRCVPLGMILCSANHKPAIVDVSSVPRHQPEPSEKPRRRRATV